MALLRGGALLRQTLSRSNDYQRLGFAALAPLVDSQGRSSPIHLRTEPSEVADTTLISSEHAAYLGYLDDSKSAP